MMSSIKHIVTWDCPHNCSFCINKFFKKRRGKQLDYSKQSSIEKLERTYAGSLVQRCKTINITGGEPTLLGNDLYRITAAAQRHFNEVVWFTTNHEVLTSTPQSLLPDSIQFNAHTNNMHTIPKISVKCPVYYCATVYDLKKIDKDTEKIASHLHQLGFTGLTINEEYPDGERAELLIPTYANFSIKYRRKEDCITGLFITPDGSIHGRGAWR